MAHAISPQAVISSAVISAGKSGAQLRIEDISKLFVDLEERGFDLGDVAIRRVPGGFYSEDVEAFIGRLLAVGYAEIRSPIKFADEGIDVCRSIIDDERQANAENLEAMTRVLGLDISES
jgi:hypothetical protein